VTRVADNADMGRILAVALGAVMLIAGCGTGSPERPLACKDITPMILDYGGPEGYETAELAARSITKNGQVVEMTSESDSESTFAVETSDGEVLANLTVLKIEDRWRVDHLTTCDPSDLDI
jgi:hypothetical protein